MSDRTGAIAVRGMKERTRRGASLLFIPGILIVVVFLLMPVVLLILRSFSSSPAGNPDIFPLTIDNYRVFIQQFGYYASHFGKTVLLAALGALLGALVAYPLALGIVTTRSRSLRFAYVFFALTPLLVSVVIRSYGWQVLLGPTGIFGQFAPGTNGFIGTDLAVVIGLGHLATPFVLLSLLPVLDNLDMSLIRAARGLGANAVQVFFQVVLTRSMPGLVSGLVVSFAVGATVVVTPQLLGGRTDRLVPNLIFDEMTVQFDWNLAASLSTVLMVVIALVAVAVSLLESWLSPLARARRASLSMGR